MASQLPRRSRETPRLEMAIGPYTRHNKIGQGSFATVYQGVHTKTRTFVAIKSVNLSKLNKKLKDNLSSEIDILKGLHHPHIVALIDCHESTSHIHLVMEFCALGDLSAFIKKRDTLYDHSSTKDMIAKYPNPPGGALNEVVVRHFLKQLSSALHFLRERDLIHRDIKPQNLLLCPAPTSYQSGSAQVVPYKGSDDSYEPMTGLETLPMLKIADFGFARSLPATSLAETLCGSPLYMAPEILRYEKYGAEADLWSVGTVLYEMVVGRPPFRATNHVELLRKIEKGEDRIRFPEENPASDDMKKLIRSLLKRNPVERLNFPEFFKSKVITDPIPGLVADDLPQDRRRPSADVTRGLLPARTDQRSVKTPTNEHHSPRELPYTTDQEERRTLVPSHRPKPPRQQSETSPSATPMQRVGSADRPSSAVVKEMPRGNTPPQRPPAVSHATAPGRQETLTRDSPPGTLERRSSRRTHAASPKVGRVEKTVEERERAAQEVAFERDYVVVEKRAVEVNAFADELAHSPRIQAGLARGSGGSMPRRATTQGLPSTGSTSPHFASKAMQIIPSRARADSIHQRQHSYERRYGQSPTSATSAISKALNMASGRLFGMGFSPPLALTKGGRSPPLAYNPFPAYPAAQASLMLTGDGGAKNSATVDEDCRAVQTIEECATRSDVVYGFAEVKYKQLIPLAPSAVTDPAVSNEDPQDLADDGLTVDALVTLSEEALVLYVKALSLLARSMDIAGAWWTRKNREDGYGDAPHRNDNTAIAGARINNVVQWVRSRFNEVLEKAEFVRLKLIENQKRLPPDHPSHPGNHAAGSTVASSGSGDVAVSPGVTAERLMYDRALEMSRTAAISELTGEDLAGCEIAYVTAIRMLEAVLEEDGLRASAGQSTSQSSQSADKRTVEGLEGEDRQVIVKLVSSMRGRLAALRKKLVILSKRPSAATPTMTSGRFPSSNLVPVAHATGATPPR
ncbi:Serine/threonine-protein kinase atg1 [Penicillium oxalicum]|uniref:Serine/threonine-protein kinase atg1 n=1 Tax=Penicillium oxalicum TaxID=69781 RepID=UPI0020B76F26|nr:Serine/threonine-protein kinase atg1 [Penicillium oxalicum]KAI2792426.1 Serine/threonine-protein kinase atg1 [Penicillium oxalicum]UKG18862.1 serine/threonine protein kinase POX02455 [Penicillium oxalicum]